MTMPSGPRELAWGEFRDGPDYQPTDRYAVRPVFDAGFEAGVAAERERIVAAIREAVGPVVKHSGGSGGVYEFSPNGTATEFWSYGNAVAYSSAVNEVLRLIEPAIDLDARATTYAGGRDAPRSFAAAIRADDREEDR